MAKAKLLEFTGAYFGRIPPKQILEQAVEARLNDVVVLGESDNGFYLAASTGELFEVLLLLEVAKKRILEMVDG